MILLYGTGTGTALRAVVQYSINSTVFAALRRWTPCTGNIIVVYTVVSTVILLRDFVEFFFQMHRVRYLF